MNEEQDVTFATLQFEMRKVGNPLAQRAEYAGCFVASVGQSYSNNPLSSASRESAGGDDRRWAGEGGPPG